MPNVVHLPESPLKPADEADLRWFFTQADGVMGLQSNMHAQVARIMLGAQVTTSWNPNDESIDQDQVGAASRYRRISEVVHRLSRDHQETLRVVFGISNTLPLAARRALSELGELAHLAGMTGPAQLACGRRGTPVALAHLVTLVHQAAGGGQKRVAARATLDAIIESARYRFVDAATAYRDARLAQRAHRRREAARAVALRA